LDESKVGATHVASRPRVSEDDFVPVHLVHLTPRDPSQSPETTDAYKFILCPRFEFHRSTVRQKLFPRDGIDAHTSVVFRFVHGIILIDDPFTLGFVPNVSVTVVVTGTVVVYDTECIPPGQIWHI
jgi:hypothetical protein